mgnify:CR=1 FL=1
MVCLLAKAEPNTIGSTIWRSGLSSASPWLATPPDSPTTWGKKMLIRLAIPTASQWVYSLTTPAATASPASRPSKAVRPVTVSRVASFHSPLSGWAAMASFVMRISAVALA